MSAVRDAPPGPQAPREGFGARVARLRRNAPTGRTVVPGRDLTAGVMVGLVALPLALGFGASSGMGATAGLITAIVAGALAAVFGGSRVQVSGPTGAMTVVLVPIIATYGAHGVLVVGLMAGLILIGLGYAGAGRFIRYVPIPVVEGFTVGIGVIIALQQVPSALGVDVHATNVVVLAVDAVRAWLTDPVWAPLAMAAGVALLVLLLARGRPRWPGALVAVVLAAVANSVFGWGVASIGHIPSRLPAPSLPTVPAGELGHLILPALAVAALAALESLLSATVADAMSVGDRHDSNRELIGQGLANLVGTAVRRHPRHGRHRPYGGQRPLRGLLTAGRADPRASSCSCWCSSARGGWARSRWPHWPASWSPPRPRWSRSRAWRRCCARRGATPPSWP